MKPASWGSSMSGTINLVKDPLLGIEVLQENLLMLFCWMLTLSNCVIIIALLWAALNLSEKLLSKGDSGLAWWLTELYSVHSKSLGHPLSSRTWYYRKHEIHHYQIPWLLISRRYTVYWSHKGLGLRSKYFSETRDS